MRVMKDRARRLFRDLILLSVALAICCTAPAQQLPEPDAPLSPAYERMLAEVNKIAIYDNHGHPGYSDDPDVDAMTSPPGGAPLRLRAGNPELIAASKALFQYPYDDDTPEHLKWLVHKKAELRRQAQGTAYFDSILDKLNVEQALANRVHLGPYLDPRRFHWVFFVDSMLFPFDNRAIRERNGDLRVYMPLQEQKLQHELSDAGLKQIPSSFDDYLAFVTHTVEANQKKGGVAIKFEIAYFRSLYFADPPKDAAAAVYAKYSRGGDPSPEEYTLFQDYLFRYLLREADRLRLPVHIHTAVGIGDYFHVTEGNVLNLENVLRDPRYEQVVFVLLHGGCPFQEQAIWLATRKNVYLDSSLMSLFLYPADLKIALRHWMLLYPDKIMFGSDAFPFNEAVGAEESYWIAVRSARTALSAALAEMVANHEVSEQMALQFAHAYLHDTAARLYGSASATSSR